MHKRTLELHRYSGKFMTKHISYRIIGRIALVVESLNLLYISPNGHRFPPIRSAFFNGERGNKSIIAMHRSLWFIAVLEN